MPPAQYKEPARPPADSRLRLGSGFSIRVCYSLLLFVAFFFPSHSVALSRHLLAVRSFALTVSTMRYSLAVLVAVFAASALAAPHPGGGDGLRHRHRRSVCSKKSKPTTLAAVSTTTTPAAVPTSTSSTSTSAVYVAPSSSSVSSVAPASYSVETSSPLSTTVEFDKKEYSSAWSSAWTSTWAATETYAAPTTTSTSAPVEYTSTPTYSSPPDSTAASMIEIINSYRSNANLGTLSWNQTLADNAEQTCVGAGGNSLTHHMYPGTLGQVMVYGSSPDSSCNNDADGETPFGLAWYSWLCEVPNGAGLGSEFCDAIYNASNINNEGQTGHYDILSSDTYKQIGCGFYADPNADPCSKFSGVWTCDVC